MSEAWQIAMAGCAVTMILAVLGWIAYELRELRKGMEKFVTKRDCEMDMEGHCRKLDDLAKKIERNTDDITKLKTGYKIYHKNGGIDNEDF